MGHCPPPDSTWLSCHCIGFSPLRISRSKPSIRQELGTAETIDPLCCLLWLDHQHIRSPGRLNSPHRSLLCLLFKTSLSSLSSLMSFSIATNLPVHLELHGESDNDEEPELSWLHTNKEQTWVFTPSSSTSSVRQVLTVTSFNVDTKALASGGGTLQVFTKTSSGQSHSSKMNVRFVCATDLQEITLIRKEGELYKERLEALQGTVVPEYQIGRAHV